VTGPLFDRLVREMAEVKVLFDLTTEKVEALKG
jgi:hypothetical protein